jgi:hypothetical protein
MICCTDQPDDPGPDFGPLVFLPVALGREGHELIFFGTIKIGEIVPRTWMRMHGYDIRIALPEVRPSIQASTARQARIFAMQEVQDWVARTPMRLEARR